MVVRDNGMVFGVGINDIREPTTIKVLPEERLPNGRLKREQNIYYCKWTSMLSRCYSSSFQDKNTTYKGCTVCEEWLLFSKFKTWLLSQHIMKGETYHLDKDILIEGNKIYSPETCVIVPRKVNNFIRENKSIRGGLLVGVKEEKSTKLIRYTSTCRNPLNPRNKGKHVGCFATEIEAHLAWKKRKHEISLQLVNYFPDLNEKVKEVLCNRYKNYNIVEEYLS